MFDNLTPENFTIFAIKAYETPSNLTAEFENDIKIFKYLKRLARKYVATGEFATRLVLNHVIILHNVFDTAATRMLFFKLDEDCWPMLKTVLLFLNRMPKVVPGVRGVNIQAGSIPIDPVVVRELRKI